MVIAINNLNKTLSGNQVLKDINLTIDKGTITSFIGPNGAGKSTLLGIMARLSQADTGSVEIDGKNVHTYSTTEIAKVLSILKQSNHIQLRLTVRDLVSFGRYPHSQAKLTAADYEKIDQAIAYMDLEEFSNRYIDELSGGQRQRAYISMVLAQDTDYIFLDEPLNNLDMKHSVQIMKVLRDLVDNHGKTVVIVLHDINFASAYSDQIIALKCGKVTHTGKVEQIMNSKVLYELYDLEIPIHQVDGKYIATYFS